MIVQEETNRRKQASGVAEASSPGLPAEVVERAVYVPMEKRGLGLVAPHPARFPHPCNDMTAQVHVGDGAVMTIVNPYNDPHVEWCLRYGNTETVRYTAASLLDSYDYLLSTDISMKEATRRLRLMRAARTRIRDNIAAGRPPLAAAGDAA